ncbi:hypothetical protein RND81_06G094700 [Saponaria officinalis]|uniref:Myb-like domain-containing protein n=1 Tax=Saponaria officinalis TaxID=3572 RepID=A0AAW1K7X8_SAPOF
MAEQQGMVMREYRKGNWTVEETMILIEAKKMDDERRKHNKKQTYQNIITSPASNTSSSSLIVKPVTELRWKWVEEYCWRKGCLRSQNQCNDKWDNLMRDYKKIRDYQRTLFDESCSSSNKSYWEMDKVERKDKSLPTNMLPQIYQSLFEVVEQTPTTPATAVAAGSKFLQLPLLSPPPPPLLRLRTELPFYSQQPQQPPQLLSTTLESEASEQVREEPSEKRRRKEERTASAGKGTTAAHQMATTTTTATPTPTIPVHEVSSSISRSASIIAEAIQSNEEKNERRHKEMMHIHETRLRLEESKLEVIRHGFNGLNDAINKLANSILALANDSNKSHQGP